MPDYPMTTPEPSTPQSELSPEITYLLTALDAVPRDELPDGDARAHLVECIREGLIDNVYRPMGADYHNIAWATRQPWVDPRQRISDFLANFIGYTAWALAHNIKPITPQEARDDLVRESRPVGERVDE